MSLTPPASNGRSKLDILAIATLLPLSRGAGISAQQLLSAFSRRGHRIRTLCASMPEVCREALDFDARHPQLQITRYDVPYPNRTPYIPCSPDLERIEGHAIQREMKRAITERRPNVILTNRELHVPDVLPVSVTEGVPVVSRMAGGSTFGLLKGNYPPDATERLFNSFRQIATNVSLTNWMADAVRQRSVQNVDVIPNAIDLALFQKVQRDEHLRRELAIGENDIVVAAVASLIDRKRPMDVVRSAAETLQALPRLVYLMAGNGPMLRELEEYCRTAGILNRVRFLGWVEYEKIPRLMRLADIVVMASEGEGLARVYLEAQCLGRVLIASDIPPAKEVVEHMETGMLFRLGDVAQLSDMTLKAAADPRLREEIGRKARERAQAHSIEVAAEKFLEVFYRVSRSSKNCR